MSTDATFASVMEDPDIEEASRAVAGSSARFHLSLPRDIPLPRCNITKNSPGKGMEVFPGLNVREIVSRFGDSGYFTFSFRNPVRR